MFVNWFLRSIFSKKSFKKPKVTFLSNRHSCIIAAKNRTPAWWCSMQLLSSQDVTNSFVLQICFEGSLKLNAYMEQENVMPVFLQFQKPRSHVVMWWIHFRSATGLVLTQPISNPSFNWTLLFFPQWHLCVMNFMGVIPIFNNLSSRFQCIFTYFAQNSQLLESSCTRQLAYCIYKHRTIHSQGSTPTFKVRQQRQT